MKVSFTVLGEPRGKSRPRFVKRGNFVDTYTPDETVMYENLIKTEYQRQCGGSFFPQKTPIAVSMYAKYSIPQNISKKKRNEMLTGTVRPTKKPDVDNLVKVYMDALNKVAFYDDVQVVELFVSKMYSEQPRVVVVIENLYAEDEG